MIRKHIKRIAHATAFAAAFTAGADWAMQVHVATTQRASEGVTNAQPMTSGNVAVAQKALTALALKCPAFKTLVHQSKSLRIEAVLDTSQHLNHFIKGTGWHRYLDVLTWDHGRLVDYQVGAGDHPGIVAVKPAQANWQRGSKVCGQAVNERQLGKRPFIPDTAMKVVNRLQ